MKQAAKTPALPNFKFERVAWKAGYSIVAGVDEAGRGALAGPVVAAAVILDRKRYPKGIDDSKKLTAKRRELLREEIIGMAVASGVGVVDAEEIDRINILQASLLAMRHALERLSSSVDCVLVDGNRPITGWDGQQTMVIDGDALSLSIAAASILAKVERDRIMCEYESAWPGYGFHEHAGYGTPAHRDAISRNGPCPIHRRSFRGVVIEPDLFSGLD